MVRAGGAEVRGAELAVTGGAHLVEGEVGAKGRAVAEDLAAGCRNNFAGSTPVLMADGTMKPIDEVRVGDKVVTIDPETGVTRTQLVTRTWVNRDTDLLDVSVDFDGRRSMIHTTQHHLFWDVTRQAWKEAGQLPLGDQLRTGDGGIAIVSGIVVVLGAANMWDLTVRTDHDFYVIAGQFGNSAKNEAPGAAVLVHNCGPAWITPGSLPAAEEATLDDTLSHIDAGTVPSGPTSKKWGTKFENKEGRLPGASGADSSYTEYRVAPPSGKGAGPLRVVVDGSNGSMYYTWTHYGTAGDPAFVRIR